MKSIRLLHITDLHFGANEQVGYLNSVDNKDKTIDSSYAERLNTHWSLQFARCIKNWEDKSNSKIDLVACTGDLGSYGKPESIEEGVAFLDTLCNNLYLSKDKFIICPGNHDLKRENKGYEFKDFEKYLVDKGFTNYSCYENITRLDIKGIPVIAINSCIGGSEVSNIFMDQYINNANHIKGTKKKKILEMLSKYGMDHLSDFLDIPSIGTKQKLEVLNIIRENNSDNAIILMHHNPLPNNSIELRPYSSVVDSGNIISELMDTEKKVFILHGHTHFDYNILAYFPTKNDNYLSSIGCGPLNGSQNSRANILEFYYTTNDRHIITKIHNIFKSGGAGYTDRYSHNIYDKSLSKVERMINVYTILDSKNSVSFTELKEQILKQTQDVQDDDIVKILLKEELMSLKIDKNGTDNYINWLISKKNN
jgi:3',5'-cyclic AMP phosphodiesterase CpdA